MTAQDRLASLFPGGRHVRVPNSTHYIHIDQPEVVIDAIEDVVEAVRAGKTGLIQ
jgi:pimeloyl-ACP methyl ester carboxylesterase